MVRFEHKLHNNAIKEWIPFYLDYRLLKKILYTEDSKESSSLFTSPRFHKINSSASRLSRQNSDSDRAPLLNNGEKNRSFDSESPNNSTAILPGEMDSLPLSSPSTSSMSETKITSNLLHNSLNNNNISIKTTNRDPSNASLHTRSSYLNSVLTGPPPTGTHWSMDSWEILKNIFIGEETIEGCGSTEVDVKMDEDNERKIFIDENGDLSPIPSLSSDAVFRSTLLSELSKIDTFYNDMVHDLEGQLSILISQSKRTEELGNLRRHERTTRNKINRLKKRSPSESNNISRGSSQGQSKSNRLDILRIPTQMELARDIESMRDVESPSREALALASSKRAYADLYRKMCFLENYCILNYTGFVKIIKKHDKINPNYRSMKSVITMIRKHGYFPSFIKLTEIKKKHQQLYGTVFCGGDNDIARAELLLKRDDEASQSVKPFLLGFRFGMCILLFCWVLWDVVIDFWYNQYEADAEAAAQLERITHKCHQSAVDKNISIAAQWFEKDFPVYRGMGSLIAWLWLWGVCLFVWTHARINYLFMLELDPRTTATYTEVWSAASSLTIVLLASFIIHFKVVICDFPRYPIPLGAWPMIPFFFILYKMIFPWNSRKAAWTVALYVVCGPFIRVTFLMNYVGDVFTSLVKPIVDMTYSICFFLTGDFLQHLGEKGTCQNKDGFWSMYIVPMIVLGPYWFRFMQCIRRYYDTGKRHPNLPNALKYALAMCVTIFSVFNPHMKNHVDGSWTLYQVFWTICYASSTLYTYSWDVLMDWSLGDSKNGGLRERRMYRRKSVYYIAIVADLILRFLWAYTLIPVKDQSNFANGVSLSLAVAPFAAIAEICRRSMWSFFRLENEHLHNTSGYRKVNHIPLHFETPIKQKTTDSSSTGKGTRTWHVIAEISVIIIIVIIISIVAIGYK